MDWLELLAGAGCLFLCVWTGKNLFKLRTGYFLALFTVSMALSTIMLFDVLYPRSISNMLANFTYNFTDSRTVLRLVIALFRLIPLVVLLVLLYYPDIRNFLIRPESVKDPDKREAYTVLH